MHDDTPPRPDEPRDTGWMSTTCPRCGARMRPVDLQSGAVVLRCRRCGMTVI